MIDESTIYWMTRLDSIKSLLVIVSIILALVCWIPILIGAVEWGDGNSTPADKKTAIKVLLAGLALVLFAFVFAVGNAFLPTTREMAAIKIIPKIANNEDIQQLGAEIPRLAKEWLEELRPKKTPVKAEAEAKQ